MISELSQPPLNILVGQMFGDIIDQESSHSSSVVSTGDGSVPLLTCSVPDLSANEAVLYFYSLSSEFHSNCSRGLSFELVFRVSEQ